MAYPDTEELREAGLALDDQGELLTVTLRRAEVRNAQTPAMWRALARIGAAVQPEVRVVVLDAAGASFSAGLDEALLSPEGLRGEPGFAEIAALPDDAAEAVIERYQQGFTWWRDPRFISVAAVQGHAVGAGFQLALACDLRILASDAQLCMREPVLGLVPDLTGTQPLVEIVGYARALEICVTARWVNAVEAAELGLATAVVPAAELQAATADLVAALTSAPVGAVRATKALLQQAAASNGEEQRRAERRAQVGRLRELVRLRPPR